MHNDRFKQREWPAGYLPARPGTDQLAAENDSFPTFSKDTSLRQGDDKSTSSSFVTRGKPE